MFNVGIIIMQSLNIKQSKLLEIQITQPDTPYAFRVEKCLSPISVQNEKIFIKCAQNRRCTFSICEQPLCKV